MAIKKLIALGCAALVGFSFIACTSNTGGSNNNSDGGIDWIGGGNGGGESGNGGNGGGNGGESGNGGNGGGNGGESGNGGNNDIVIEVDPNGGNLTFDAGDGAFLSGESSITVSVASSAETIVKIGDPRYSGYAFVGWYNGDDEYDAKASYDAATTFTARYDSGADNLVYDALFDEGSTVKISIDMSDAEWKKLDQDYVDFWYARGKSPIYRMADWVSISIETDDGETREYWYDEVGVRLKGNTSRRQFYGDDGFYANVHYKLSFTQTFDDEAEYKVDERKVWSSTAERTARKNRTLGGMEKFDVKYNKNDDDTYCRDIYAMKMFRENGIIAPQASLCSISARNKDAEFINLGVYMIYEAVDDIMIARNLPDDANGDLYKCSWGSDFGATLTQVAGMGVEDEMNGLFYTYDKKTNKKKGHTNLENLINVINGYSPDYSSVVDLDYFAKFEAVNYILGNPDCIRNNANNYYIYFLNNGKAIFIPFDYDRCLGITKDWNPADACKYLEPYTRMTAVGSGQENPLYVNLIDKGAPYDAGSVLMKYREKLLELANGDMFAVATFNAFKNNYAAHYSSLVDGALGTNNVPFGDNRSGNVTYDEYISAKLNTLRNNIDNYRA